MCATNAQATTLAIVASKSFASLRQPPSHAKVRSTTHLRGRTFEALCRVGTFDDFYRPFPLRFKAFRNLSPAYPPSAKIWRSQG
jgi:hypothetical protein